jgi:hypothetical protein
VQIQPYLFGDAAYPIQYYIFKGFKLQHFNMVDEIRFNRAMNKGHVVIENPFGTLKNRWRILRIFNA